MDIVIGAIILLGVIIGFAKGFINQLFALVGLAAGLLIANLFYATLGEQLAPVAGTSQNIANIIVFIIILLVVPLIFGFLGTLLTKLFKIVHLNFINRLLGAALGFIIFALLTGIVLNIIQITDTKNNLISQTSKDSSLLYYPIQVNTHFVFSSFDDIFSKSTWEKIKDGYEDAKEKVGEKMDEASEKIKELKEKADD